MLFRNIKQMLVLAAIGFVFLLPHTTQAALPGMNPLEYYSSTQNQLREQLNRKPLLQIRIPGLTFSNITSSSNADGTFYYISWIPELITTLYKFSIAIVSIVATVIILVQGVRITTSGGNSEAISGGYKKIGHAVIGLFIAWGSFVILYTVNPKLVEFNPLKVKIVERQEIAEPEEPSDEPLTDVILTSTTPANGFCVDPQTLTTIKDIPYVRSQASPNLIRPEVIAALKRAGELATQTTDPQTGKKFDGLIVVSAVRTLTRQQDLFEQALKKYGTEEIARSHVGKPQGCGVGSSHLSGQAVDIHLLLDGKRLQAKDMTEIRINLFQDDIMTPAGWVRYCPEWWHFEVGSSSNKPLRSTRCDRPYGTGNSRLK